MSEVGFAPQLPVRSRTYRRFSRRQPCRVNLSGVNGARRQQRDVSQLFTRLSGTLAVGGLLLGLIGSWLAAFLAFGAGVVFAAAAWVIVRRRGGS